ncbi:MAG TPA: dihydrofolate reductase family protein [Mucilaginibacter sp.]|jgi:dihydrofolate reductase|nr:dihydrofolate reductase family protein [Mucilaginibacter sp.]
MRKVICGLNISIDGCYDHTKMSGSEEILEFFADLMQGVDQIVTGRKMHELMVPYWPKVARTQSGTPAANAFANAISAIDTIVISRTMEQVEGGPRIIRGGLEDEIRKLKQQPGKNISIGGMTVRSQLMAAGLIDELYVVVHPVIAGTGPRLFNDISLDDTIKMELVDTKVFKNGCVVLQYVKP